MPTNDFVAGTQRLFVAVLIALLVLPPTDAFAFGHKKKKPKTVTAAGDSPLSQDQRVLLALNRLTFGPRPGDAAAVNAMGLDKWIDEQLNPEGIDDSALEARLAEYPAMQLSLGELTKRFPSPAMIRQAEMGRRGLPGDPVERAIYRDQIAVLEQRQQKKQGAGQGTKSGEQGAGVRDQNSAAGPAMKQDDMAPPPPPDMMTPAPAGDGAKAPDGSPANGAANGPVTAPSAGPSTEQVENKLYADLGATRVVQLPPEERVQKLIAMAPEEFRDFLAHMSRPDRIALFAGLTPEQKETVFALINPQLVVGGEVLITRVLRDIYSERQLEAVMTDFWLNHFNVYLRKGPFAPWYLAEYQDRVVRPHALGKFEDLLVATAQSPAMLFYLDQTESVGPHSMAAMRVAMGLNGARLNAPRRNGAAGKQRQLGINENYARELMELHTLGVDGGYTQQDVIEVAKAFTGWEIDRPDQGGAFEFNPRRHEPGPKFVLGYRIPEGGEREGLEILHMLAVSPATAHHVSYEMAQRFVSDNPPAAVVDAMAATWVKTGGDIREVLRTMLESPEFWSRQTYRAKVKTPEEYVISAVRATGGEVAHPAALVEAISQLGMPLYGCQTPNGYAWTADAWLNSGELLDRMNFSLALADNNGGVAMRWDELMGIAGQPDATAETREGKLEGLLLDGVVSPQTRAAALSELAQQQNEAPDSKGRPKRPRPVNFVRPREFGQLLLAAPALPPPADQQAALLAGLLLGSPDFQRR
ncbi:MAG TPA: DUF1800 domain-containing protein [Acidobacteriaceae bacterium]|jgi:uncharacterized protein (DUF1800 family)|nr:DUF1800 domain-containing protein [Acidobacteriaceae bacterium]